MAKDALKKIVKAASSWKNAKPSSAGHIYFQVIEERDWEGTDTFLGGVMGPGYFKRLEKQQEHFQKRKKKK